MPVVSAKLCFNRLSIFHTFFCTMFQHTSRAKFKTLLCACQTIRSMLQQVTNYHYQDVENCVLQRQNFSGVPCELIVAKKDL